MKIEVDTNAFDKLIQSEYERCLAEIKSNAGRGINTTDLYVDKNVSYDVSNLLRKNVDNIVFCIIRTGNNQYTGRVEHFTSETIGDERHYKVKI